MKNKILVLISFLIVVILLVKIFYKKEIKNTNLEVKDELTKLVNDKINNMSEDEKIAQMLIVSIDETKMTKKLEEELTLNKVGGVILFSSNITDYDTTHKLIDDIKSTNDIPMFISIDEEGGSVQRLISLKEYNCNIPSMFELGKTNDSDLSYQIGKVIAENLRTLGINMDFAPVIDVIDSGTNKVIGSRSFSTDESVVSNMGISLYKGLLDNHIIPVYKHFIAGGASKNDSHYMLPVVSKTKAELYQKDLIPFINAIKNDAKVIMVGHLSLPNITNDNTPSSLSKEVITDLLKNELNYKGLIISDALNMIAISDNYSEKEIYELGINAGLDILLMPKSIESAIKLIKESINDGNISIDRINESVSKILTIKYQYLNENYSLDRSMLCNQNHLAIISQIKNQ